IPRMPPRARTGCPSAATRNLPAGDARCWRPRPSYRAARSWTPPHRCTATLRTTLPKCCDILHTCRTVSCLTSALRWELTCDVRRLCDFDACELLPTRIETSSDRQALTGFCMRQRQTEHLQIVVVAAADQEPRLALFDGVAQDLIGRRETARG